jgi:hypothetical protein
MIKINRKNGVEFMSIDEFTRWMCLVEAFDFIERFMGENKLEVDNISSVSAIEKYINERFHAMRYDIEHEHAAGNI